MIADIDQDELMIELAAGGERGRRAMREIAARSAPIFRVPAWMLAGAVSPQAYREARRRDRHPAPVRVLHTLHIAAATLELFAVGEEWPRIQVSTIERAEVERGGPRRAGWYTIEWGGRPLAVCMPEDEPRLTVNGVAIDPPAGPERRATQGAKRRRRW